MLRFSRTFLHTVGRIVLIAMISCTGCRPPNLAKPLSPNASFQVHVATSTKSATAIPATHPEDQSAIFLGQPPLLTAADVESVKALDPNSNAASLEFQLTPAGAKKMTAATTNPNNLDLAFVINGQVVSVVKVRSAIGDAFQVTGPPIAKNITWAMKSLTN